MIKRIFHNITVTRGNGDAISKELSAHKPEWDVSTLTALSYAHHISQIVQKT